MKKQQISVSDYRLLALLFLKQLVFLLCTRAILTGPTAAVGAALLVSLALTVSFTRVHAD